MDDFDFIPFPGQSAIYPAWERHTATPVADSDVQIHSYLRQHYPGMNITTIGTRNVPLVTFANAGFATAELDTDTDSVLRWRGYIPPVHRGEKGKLGEAVFFAKYKYTWLQEQFTLYTIGSGYNQVQYILKEPGSGEDVLSHCAKSDALIKTAVEALSGDANKFVYVFDNYWTRSRELWDEVMKSSWDKVILDPKMKESLQEVSSNFFDSKELYDRYGVPWKRGLIFAGPPGNGKTISIKALMKTLYQRKEPIPTLYVKHAPSTSALAQVFSQARAMTPCLLVMEDIETIVTPFTRSYFFNEVDGLTNNGGLLMVASTNYLDRLDPGLSKRPSRFDRKFIFPLPDEHERTLYCEFWRTKLQKSHFELPFPDKLCPAMAKITDKFSFAYLQEAFIATLLVLARQAAKKAIDSEDGNNADEDGDSDGGDDNDPLDIYKLWRAFKVQVAELRENMGSEQSQDEHATGFFTPNPCVGDMASSRATTATNTSTMPLRPSSLLPTAVPRLNSPPNVFPVQEPSMNHYMTDDAVAADPTKGPDSLEMAAYGIWKRQYLAQTAYEWKG